jgi:hypothetical protein
MRSLLRLCRERRIYMLQRIQRVAITVILLGAGLTLLAFGQPTPQQVEGSGWQALTNAAPAVASNGTNRYIAWQGLNDKVYFAMYNGSEWTDHQIVGGTGWTAETSASPALQYGGYGNTVWLAYKGKSTNNIYFTTWDGTSWSDQQQVQGTDPDWTAQTNVGPGLGAFAFTPYIAWKGATTNDVFFSYQLDSWSPQQVVGGSGWTAETSAAPALSYDDAGDQLWFWKGLSGDSIWGSDGIDYPGPTNPEWEGQSTLGCSASTNAGPAAAEFSNPDGGIPWLVVVFWKSSSSNDIYYDYPCGGTVSGSKWSASTNAAPAVATYSGDGQSTGSILAWKNASNTAIYWMDPTTLPGMTVFAP